jgi:hypothetical protein
MMGSPEVFFEILGCKLRGGISHVLNGRCHCIRDDTVTSVLHAPLSLKNGP